MEDVCKRPYPSERAYRKINETVQHFVLYLILGRPGICLCDIVSELSAVLGLDVTESAVCKFLKKVGFTHHKLATFALQRDDTLRKQFVSDVYPFISMIHFCLWMKRVQMGEIQ